MSLDKRPFNPSGPTINVDAATSAPAGLQASGVRAEQYRIQNNGTVTAFVAFGDDASEAQSNAVIPTGGGNNAKNSFPLPAGAIEVISGPIDCYWSAITASGTAEIYITPGKGI